MVCSDGVLFMCLEPPLLNPVVGTEARNINEYKYEIIVFNN